MPRLSLYLPAFAADYAGVCSSLFDLDLLVVVIDAACCTRNYVDYDEPRWSRTKTPTLCAQLRSMDVVMGDERSLITKVVQAARELTPQGIAVLGSPVPAITGMDLAGLAREIEAETGLSSLGFATTGFASYERGINLAHQGLIKKFCHTKDQPSKNFFDTTQKTRKQKEASAVCTSVPSFSSATTVNILGLTPLDFGADNVEGDLRDILTQAGLSVRSSWGMGLTLETLSSSPAADVNLVVSTGAILAAQLMERSFKIPYVIGIPCVGTQASLVVAALRRTAATGVSTIACRPPESGSAYCDNASSSKPSKGILIVGDWVCAASLRSALRGEGCQEHIAIASFFGPRPSFTEAEDNALADERSLQNLIKDNAYRLVIGDPLLEHLPAMHQHRLLRLAHPAVSSDLFSQEIPQYFAKNVIKDL